MRKARNQAKGISMDATSHFQSTEIKKHIYVPGRQLALSARLSGGPYKLDGLLKI